MRSTVPCSTQRVCRVIPEQEQQAFTLGDIKVSVAHNSLSLNHQTTKLQPKAMAVLHYLACHFDRVVSTEELMEQLWAGRVVTPGSVQKSINAIRNGFEELSPEQEFIRFFSKRGYQLLTEPVFESTSLRRAENINVPPETARVIEPVNSSAAHPQKIHYRYVLLAALFCGLVFSGFNLVKTHLNKHHHTTFPNWLDLTVDKGHERAATPHPDNQHLAYIRENFINDLGESESHLIIRDGKGVDWQLALSTGSWFKLAWSPSGKHLAAVEVKRLDGKRISPNFFEKPNFIYSFHFFTVDLQRKQLLEKQTLSQWQGRIASINWWDDDTLEILAKQGPSAGNSRYRYNRITQALTQLNDAEGIHNPTAACILNRHTALASSQGNLTQIDFLNEQQQSTARYTFNYPHLDISWIPDGTGLLAFADEAQKLMLIYRDGTHLDIPLKTQKDHIYSRANFGPLGDKIYLSLEQRRSNILEHQVSEQQRNLTQNTFYNFGATYNHITGDVVYASIRENNIHLFLYHNGKETQLTQQALNEKPKSLKWNTESEQLYFSGSNNLYQLDINTQKLLLIHAFDNPVDIIGFIQPNTIAVTKTLNDIKNLWLLDLTTQQEKQLTFGSLASSLVADNKLYLQYLNEPGLWQLDINTKEVANQLPLLPANSKLFTLQHNQLYFLTGGNCRESAVFRANLAEKTISTFLDNAQGLTSTTDVNPHFGLLQTPCYIPESHIGHLH